MKQSIQLRLGQQLTMTPQLQQAIRLLQLSMLDLQQEIQEALDSNLMLEVDEEENEVETQPADGNGHDRDSSVEPEDIPTDLPVDSVWEDIYDSIPTYSSGASAPTALDLPYEPSTCSF